MEYQSTDDLIRVLSHESRIDASKKLTNLYAKARFGISDDDFYHQYTDGTDDGGIDFYFKEDNTFFIFQTKFSRTPRKVNSSEILDEIRKLKNTLTNGNPNKRADDFVNALKREFNNKDAVLEILWLTTNIVGQSIRNEIQSDIDLWKKENEWMLGIEFIVIDKNVLESVIYDVRHGYIPYTGKRTLRLEKNQWIETVWENTGVYSVVCNINVNDILKWFQNSEEIDRFLQKNVREFLGESIKINKTVGKSYIEDPVWFWYKHNGIIVFADNLFIDKERMELVLRNPQVVNGGQTLKVLFNVYNRNNKCDNPAKVLLRVYRLPYEDTETYRRSIEIISALNSQNRINPSDLRSTDPRQVRIEQLLKRVGEGYTYFRKRSREAKSGQYSITMRNLALRYYVCKKNAPHEGVRGNVEDLFEEENKYNDIFDEVAINKEITGNHIVIDYITCWNIDQVLQKIELPREDFEFFPYTKWFVLWDIYKKLMEWKQKKFNAGWQIWINFIESPQFKRAVTDYSCFAFRIGRKIIPLHEEPRSFFKTKDAVTKFSIKVRAKDFNSIINRAYTKFQRES